MDRERWLDLLALAWNMRGGLFGDGKNSSSPDLSCADEWDPCLKRTRWMRVRSVTVEGPAGKTCFP